MATDPVSLEFLGEQLKRVQADIRDLKGRVLLLESDQAEFRRDLARAETKIDVLSERMDDRFDQMDQRFLDLFKLIAGIKHDINGSKGR